MGVYIVYTHTDHIHYTCNLKFGLKFCRINKLDEESEYLCKYFKRIYCEWKRITGMCVCVLYIYAYLEIQQCHMLTIIRRKYLIKRHKYKLKYIKYEERETEGEM